MKKIFIGIGTAIAVLIALWVFVINPPRTDYYTQIDNLKYKENHSDGGVVDLTGGMEYLYTLKSYTPHGKEKEITFGTNKILKDKAFLKLEYTATRGVLSWCEVGWEELPESLQSIYQKP
ncbi:MAG: YxeA family protein [Oscillospiraceae bacterium]|nr:YxeA family protein [Oscillospiraceae bacterium]